MENGRCRISYEARKIDIHNVSAMAVDPIEFRSGKEVTIDIDIVMNHTAGVFHIDELLSEKIKGSGLESHLNITVYICNDGKRELFREILLTV